VFLFDEISPCHHLLLCQNQFGGHQHVIHLLLGWFLQVDDRPKTPVSIFFGFSGEFDFNVPNEEMSAITHRIIQGEQALQMYQCQMQTYQYQMNPLQAQAHIQ
jgi:hypothetical protein